ncbi:MAG: hypothetical protein E4H01_08520 [Lysobacterales bacterium]|nr:MAG: hypothetical protein E4H01_08520 [Xanthomonadales bacterium]
MKAIGGRLSLKALALLARPERQHRPDDPHLLATAARELADQGLTAHDIGKCLDLTAATVRELLAPSTEADTP